MEVKETSGPAWLDKNHPNYERWKRARAIANDRGRFAISVIEQSMVCEGLTILDLGSGQGGTAEVLSEKNNVFSMDIDLSRLNAQKEFADKLFRINGNALQIPLKNKSFDLIILQDVIEHITNPEKIISLLHNLLKENGIIYLSTPNRNSVFNFIADPHWGLPIVAVLKRETIRKFFLKYFRKSEYHRKDIAQLFSLNELFKIFSDNFRIKLNTKYSVRELFNGNKGIVWSNFHLNLINFINIIKLNKLVVKIANDKPGTVNNLVSPTFYLILKKL